MFLNLYHAVYADISYVMCLAFIFENYYNHKLNAANLLLNINLKVEKFKEKSNLCGLTTCF